MGSSHTTKVIRTILVEDHEITRIGLRKILESIPVIEIIAEVACGNSAVSKVKELRPDLVLMDIRIPNLDGIAATREIKGRLGAEVIMLTSEGSRENIVASLTAGADAYCLKGISKSQLAICISSVMEGALWLDSAITAQLLTCFSGPVRAMA